MDTFFPDAHHFNIDHSFFINVAENQDDQRSLFGNGDEERIDRGLELLSQHVVTGASYNAEQRYPPPICYKGTRTQIRETLEQWVTNDHKDKSIYWIYGAVGVGKSAVAQTISKTAARCVLDNRSTGRLAASFFFSRIDSSRNNSFSFFTTIAHQLMSSDDFGLLKREMGRVICRKRDIVYAALEQQFQELILQPCARLTDEQWKMLPRLIVIDGLDECIAIESQKRLLKIILQSSTPGTLTPCPFKFLIFSRPEPHISEVFKHPPFHSILDSVDLESFESKEDMSHYLRNEFKRIRCDYGHSMAHTEPDWPGYETIQKLVQKACGQFIYVATVIKYVGDISSSMTPTEKLEIILETTVPEDSDSPYPELDSLYMQILSGCKDNKILLLDVLAHLLRPQDSNIFFQTGFAQNNAVNIEALFCLPRGKTWTLFHGLHSILIIPDNDDNAELTVRHTSFADYLTDRKRSKEYFVDNGHQACHAQIAVYLIKRLVDTFKNTSDRKHANAEFDAYAWEFWNAHCQEVVGSPSTRLLAALKELDLCALVKTAMMRSSTDLETCVLALRNCMDRMESIAQWAKELNLSSTLLRYRTLQNGFRLQLPSRIQSRQREELELAITMLKYGLCLDQPHSTVVISALMKRRLTPEQFGNTLRHYRPNLTVLPLKIDPLSQLHPNMSMVQPHAPDPHDGAHEDVNIIFSECHREILVHFLQIIRSSSQNAKETDLIYAQSHWIRHLLITEPSKENVKTLLKNMSSLKTSEDAKKALTWIQGSNELSASQVRDIQTKLEKRASKLIKAEEEQVKPRSKSRWNPRNIIKKSL